MHGWCMACRQPIQRTTSYETPSSLHLRTRLTLRSPPGARTDEIGLNIGGPVDSTEWHYLDTANAQQGPCTADTMKQLLAAGSIHQATYVWNEAMPAWCEYSQSSLASGGTMPPGMRSVAF
mgnify:CR=1 FL=1